MKILKRQLVNTIDKELGFITVFRVLFTNNKGVKKYCSVLTEDPHTIYTEEFIKSYLMAIKVHGDY